MYACQSRSPQCLIIYSSKARIPLPKSAQATSINLLKIYNSHVAVLLVQNGVMPARAGACSKEFDALLNSTVVIIADKFALQQREISSNELKQNIYIGTLEHAIDALLAGHKVIWN